MNIIDIRAAPLVWGAQSYYISLSPLAPHRSIIFPYPHQWRRIDPRVPQRIFCGYRFSALYFNIPPAGAALTPRVPKRTVCGYRIGAKYIPILPNSCASTPGYRNGPVAVTVSEPCISRPRPLAPHRPTSGTETDLFAVNVTGPYVSPIPATGGDSTPPGY